MLIRHAAGLLRRRSYGLVGFGRHGIGRHGVPIVPVHGLVVRLAVAPDGVRVLPVYRVVTGGQLLLGEPEWHEHPDDEAHDARHGHVERHDEGDPGQLQAHLPQPGAGPSVLDRVREADVPRVVAEEEPREPRIREHPGQQAAEAAGHAVRVQHGERVVDARQETDAPVQQHHGAPRHAPRDGAHEHRRPALHQPGGGGDADEAGDHALDRADDGGAAEEDAVEAEPDQDAGGRAEVRVDHGDRRVDAGGVRRAAVEPRPPHPQQPRAGERQEDVVGRERLPVLGRPRTNLRMHTNYI
jgi:hypothetical protein